MKGGGGSGGGGGVGGGGSSGEHFTHLGLHFFHIGRGGVGSAPPKVRVEDFRLWVEEVELVEDKD